MSEKEITTVSQGITQVIKTQVSVPVTIVSPSTQPDDATANNVDKGSSGPPVGLVAGIVCGCAALGLVIALIVIRTRRTRRREESSLMPLFGSSLHGNGFGATRNVPPPLSRNERRAMAEQSLRSPTGSELSTTTFPPAGYVSDSNPVHLPASSHLQHSSVLSTPQFSPNYGTGANSEYGGSSDVLSMSYQSNDPGTQYSGAPRAAAGLAVRPEVTAPVMRR
jgi:hypothetical protein